MSRLRLIAALAIALVLVLPATALAATYDVGGTVTDKGGAPVAGAEVTILVQGTDQILSTTSDANGAWSIQVDVDPGAVLEVNGTGPATTSEPDADGCITTTTTSGQLQATIPAEGQVDPVALVLDKELSGKVCSATGKPDKPAKPGTTPPATDAIAAPAGGAGNGSLLLVAGLVAFIGATIALTATRRPRRR
ncbi:MAG TPA: carboxypeptidase-like regulatory domain-containing protein [Candidatus Limnocylindrales bacterium]|nr:carboxypeptidase-like regulatory domain-containing protein [Candidatus Limnocylindrales bacterium]